MSAFHTDSTNPLNSFPTVRKGPPKFQDYFSGSSMDSYGTSPNDPENVKRRQDWWKAHTQYEADRKAYYSLPENRPGYNVDMTRARELSNDIMQRNPEAYRSRGYNPSYGRTASFTNEFGNVVNQDQAPPRDQAPPFGVSSQTQTDLRKLLRRR